VSDEFGIQDIPASPPERRVIPFTPLGTPVTPQEVAARLSNNLYIQLSEGSEEVTNEAITRAEIYVGAILRRLGVAFNLDERTVREVVLINTVYELHIALGHEEAGKEYRMKAKDLILAAWGDYPDAENKAPAKAVAAAVAAPERKGFYP
jgi:hypothetical protein